METIRASFDKIRLVRRRATARVAPRIAWELTGAFGPGDESATTRRPSLAYRLYSLIDDLLLDLADCPEPNVTWVTNDLAIGGRILADEWSRLHREGVDAVVDCRSEARDPEHLLDRLGIRFLHLPTPDCSDFDDATVARGAAWIEEQRQGGRRVLVHCRAGKGRSVLLCAAALTHQGVSPDESLALIQAKRPIVTPTPGQVARLKAYWNRRDTP